MRADVVPGALFPDYEVTDHTGKHRKLSGLQGPDPVILVLSRGGFCPKHRRWVRLVVWRDIDSGALQVIVDDYTQYRAVFDTATKVSPTRYLGRMALRAAKRWSLGKTTIKGSLTRTQYANSGTPLSRRRNGASIFPFDRPPVSNGEY